jgi:hypothetical protein
MRDVYPVKYYKDEGFVEYKIEIDEEDLKEIIEDYLMHHAEVDFDEIEIVNNRPMNIWLYAKCRKYIDPDAPEEEQITDAEVEVSGRYDDSLTGGE